MLINLKYNEQVHQQLIRSAKELELSERYLASCPDNLIDTGIYNFNNISNEIGPGRLFDSYKMLDYDDCYNLYPMFSEKDQYGLADDIEQIKEYFKDEINDPEKTYIIEVNKLSDFRWHKWGTYIGNYEPQCEHFVDEDFGPDFQGYVIAFHIYPITEINK